MTQGDPLSPTIFNAVVDYVMRHWLTMVATDESVPERYGSSIQRLAVYFYAIYSLIMLMQAGRIKMAFYVLKDLFDNV